MGKRCKEGKLLSSRLARRGNFAHHPSTTLKNYPGRLSLRLSLSVGLAYVSLLFAIWNLFDLLPGPKTNVSNFAPRTRPVSGAVSSVWFLARIEWTMSIVLYKLVYEIIWNLWIFYDQFRIWGGDNLSCLIGVFGYVWIGCTF